MKPELKYFKTEDFHTALQTFFQNLSIPIGTISAEPARPKDILERFYKKDHPAHQLMEDVYFLGMVDDAAFEGNAGLAPEKIESDFDREVKNSPPTEKQNEKNIPYQNLQFQSLPIGADL